MPVCRLTDERFLHLYSFLWEVSSGSTWRRLVLRGFFSCLLEAQAYLGKFIAGETGPAAPHRAWISALVCQATSLPHTPLRSASRSSELESLPGINRFSAFPLWTVNSFWADTVTHSSHGPHSTGHITVGPHAYTSFMGNVVTRLPKAHPSSSGQ